MSGDSGNTIKLLCTESNKVKDTYYGSIHRANFSINGEKGEWDILQISIPFSPQKEAELMRRFELDRNDLPEFYGYFEKAVVRHSSLVHELNETGITAIAKSIVSYKTVKYYPRLSGDGTQIGQDFYFITEPMDCFVGSDIIQNNGAYLKDINNLAIRLLQTAKTFNENGYSIGAVDLDSCFYAEDEGKKYLKLAYCFYSAGPDTAPEKYMGDVSSMISEQLVSGDVKQSLDTDVRMICALIWNLLDGRHYTEPNTNAWIVSNFYSEGSDSFPQNLAPSHADADMTSLLVEGMTRGANAMKVLQAGIRSVNCRIDNGELENIFVLFSEPSYYSKPLPELREEFPEEAPMQSENVSFGNPDSSTGKNKKRKKQKSAGLLIFAASVLAFLGIVLFQGSGANAFLHGFFGTKARMSASQGLYSAEGNVVRSDRTAAAEYDLDEDGNIVLKEDHSKIIYPAARVSEFIYLNDIQISIIKKSFSRAWNLAAEERVLRDDIIDLRQHADITYDSVLGEDNMIPYSLVKQYGITDSSLLLIKDKNYPELNFKVAMLVKQSADTSDADANAENNGTEEKPAEPETVAVRAVTGVSDDSLYKVQGVWEYTISVNAEPSEAVYRKISLTSDDPENMYFLVADGDGHEIKCKTVKMTVKNDDTRMIKVIGLVEGKYTITVESEDGAVQKKISMRFDVDEGFPAASMPVQPTATPEPTPRPTLWIAATPTPFMEQNNGYGSGNWSSGSSDYPSASDEYTYAVPFLIPESDTSPVYTPAPDLPLSCNISSLEMTVGEAFRLGDQLDGIENYAALMCRTSTDGVVTVSPAQGFLITAVSTGETVVTIQKGIESIDVAITVS